jgi:hypothetical protein
MSSASVFTAGSQGDIADGNENATHLAGLVKARGMEDSV